MIKSTQLVLLFAFMWLALAQAQSPPEQKPTDGNSTETLPPQNGLDDEMMSAKDELEEAKWEYDQVKSDCDFIMNLLESEPDPELESALEGCNDYLNQISKDMDFLTQEMEKEGGSQNSTISSSNTTTPTQ